MKDLAPEITRQRLLIEGHYSIEVTEERVREYLSGLAGHLDLRTYGEATVHSTGGAGRAENQGYDAFIPLIDSGISIYVWSESRFFASLLFTCKEFDNDRAVGFTREYFGAGEIVHSEF